MLPFVWFAAANRLLPGRARPGGDGRRAALARFERRLRARQEAATTSTSVDTVFGDYRARLVGGLAAGLTLEELDEQILAEAPLDEDDKAALWLYGFSLLDGSEPADRGRSRVTLSRIVESMLR